MEENNQEQYTDPAGTTDDTMTDESNGEVTATETTDIVKSESNLPMKINTGQLVALVGLVLLLVMPVFGKYIDTLDKKSTNEIAVDEVALPNPFEGLGLEAKAVYVLDATRGEVLYAYNEQSRLPLASLTKIMTAVVATEMIPQSTVVSINAEDIALEGDSGLLTDERWRLSDIIDFTLITSSNDGASAIATVAGSFGQVEYDMPIETAKKSFVSRMNEKAQELELLHTYFLNETGLDQNPSISGAYGSARDIAHLMWYALGSDKPVLEATAYDRTAVTSLNDISHTATNTNASVNAIPGLIASKTGFTELAGGNLVVAFDAGLGRPIIISILGSSIDGRFSDVEKIAKATLRAIAQQ